MPFTTIRSGATAARLACATPGLLEAALFRPQTGYYPDTIAQAAALWESLAQNHPFIDGNKRAAFAAMFTFLAINGIRLTARADDTFAFIDGLYRTNTFAFEQLDAWLRVNSRPESSS